MPYFFLSFRNPKINKNLGCCQVIAANNKAAVNVAHKLGINPGGEVAVFRLQEKEDIEINRLYSPEELNDLGYQKGI